MSDDGSPAPNDGLSKKARARTIPLQKRNMFAKDLAPMMYAYGDVNNPAPDTVAMMEDILIDHICNLCDSAAKVSTARGKVKMDDVRHALRKPRYRKQLARVEELLVMEVEIKKAKAQFDDNVNQMEHYGVDGAAGAGEVETAPSAADGKKRRSNKASPQKTKR